MSGEVFKVRVRVGEPRHSPSPTPALKTSRDSAFLLANEIFEVMEHEAASPQEALHQLTEAAGLIDEYVGRQLAEAGMGMGSQS